MFRGQRSRRGRPYKADKWSPGKCRAVPCDTHCGAELREEPRGMKPSKGFMLPTQAIHRNKPVLRTFSRPDLVDTRTRTETVVPSSNQRKKC